MLLEQNNGKQKEDAFSVQTKFLCLGPSKYNHKENKNCPRSSEGDAKYKENKENKI